MGVVSTDMAVGQTVAMQKYVSLTVSANCTKLFKHTIHKVS